MKQVCRILVIAFAACGTSAMAAPRFPVTLASVAAALATQQPALAASALQIPAITASTPDPVLVVGAISPAGQGTAQVRVACRLAAECLPFLVTVHSSSPIDFAGLKASLQRSSTSLTPPDLRSGARAVLVIDSGRLRITIPVVALAGGHIGEQVRVTSLDRKITYMARIVSPDEVKGTL